MAAAGDEMQDVDKFEMMPAPSYSRQASAMTQSGRRDRFKTLGRSMRNSVADFFGVGDECPEDQEKWRQRSRNLACKRSVGGGVKVGLTRSGTMDSVFVDAGIPTPGPVSAGSFPMSAGHRAPPLTSGLHGHPLGASFQGHPLSARPVPTPIDPLHRPGLGRQFSHSTRAPFPSRQLSRQISTASSSRRSTRLQPTRRSHKDSVAKMAYDGVKTLMEDPRKKSEDDPRAWIRRTPTRKTIKRKPYLHSRSFAPTSISSYQDDIDTLKTNDILAELVNESRDRESQMKVPRNTPNRLEVPQLSWMSSSMSNSSYSSWGASRSDFSQSPMPESGLDDSVLDDVFFELPSPPAGSPQVQPYSGDAPPLLHLGTSNRGVRVAVALEDVATPVLPTLWESNLKVPDVPPAPHTTPQSPENVPCSDEDEHKAGNGETCLLKRPLKRGWSVSRQKPMPLPGMPGTPEIGIEDETDGLFRVSPMHRVPESMLDQVPENSNRREIGKGLVGRLFKRSYRTDRIDSDIKAQLDDVDDHRPFFTYWVTFVQVLIYVISVCVYGIAPIGFEETIIKAEVMMPSLAIEKKYYVIQDNFWIGPRQADLIHMGAKYSPCMRKDENIEHALGLDRIKENKTACCIRNDGSGCVQTERDKCSQTLATWYSWKANKWSNETGTARRMAGSVCGLDPRTCLSPASTGAFQWKDDITTWPVCTKDRNTVQTSEYIHINCEVVGRPCCVGIHGECIITTREYCTFRRGYFHEEASLCSQVSCMTEICGMIPFLYNDTPDQFYRFWTSLFLHAGLLQLVVTVLFQFFIMRDLEKLAGWLRIAIIYLGSGITGSMSSAIFLPYHVEAGPAGSQFGLLACLIVEVIQNWYILEHPFRSVFKLCTIVFILFTIGLLPMVDNYAHLFGFIFGFLLSFALLPYVTFGKFDRQRKLIGILLCLLTAAGFLALLVVLFYVIGVYDCPYCHYFNCIPFTPKFCNSMEVKINRTEIY